MDDEEYEPFNVRVVCERPFGCGKERVVLITWDGQVTYCGCGRAMVGAEVVTEV